MHFFNLDTLYHWNSRHLSKIPLRSSKTRLLSVLQSPLVNVSLKHFLSLFMHNLMLIKINNLYFNLFVTQFDTNFADDL